MFGFLKELFGIKSEAEKRMDERARKFEEMMDRKIESGEWVHREVKIREEIDKTIQQKATRKHPRYQQNQDTVSSRDENNTAAYWTTAVLMDSHPNDSCSSYSSDSSSCDSSGGSND